MAETRRLEIWRRAIAPYFARARKSEIDTRRYPREIPAPLLKVVVKSKPESQQRTLTARFRWGAGRAADAPPLLTDFGTLRLSVVLNKVRNAPLAE